MSSPGIFLGTPPEYVKSLQKKKETISRMCAALHDFFCHDIDQIIEEIAVGSKRLRYPKPTMEDLNSAQEEIDAMESQVDALRRMCKGMPPDMGEDFLAAQLPYLERVMKPAKDRVAMIQKAMEEPEPDPSNPWDGSHSIGLLCTQCARDFDQVASAPKILNALALKAGWGRDADGDLICPACKVGSLTHQGSEPASETGTNQQKDSRP